MELTKKLERIEQSPAIQNGLLILDDIPFVDYSQVQTVCQWLDEKKFYLTTLSLKGCHLTDTKSITSIICEDSLATRVQNITNVYAHQRLKTITRSKVDAVASLIVKRHWVAINVSQNNLSAQESDILLQAIGAQPRLRRLNFGMNALGEKGIKYLADYLEKKTCQLKYLSLSRCFNVKSKLHFSSLMNAIKNNTSLRELDVSSNEFDNNELQGLFSAINKNGTIIKINRDAGASPYWTEIDKKLTHNQEQRVMLHDSLLANDYLLAQAKYAINTDHDALLDVVIGVPKKENQEEVDYYCQQLDVFTKLRKLMYSYELASHLYEFLKPLSENDLAETTSLTDKQASLNELLVKAAKLERSIIDERFERVSQHVIEGKVVTLDAVMRKKCAQQFHDDVIFPITTQFHIKLSSAMDIPMLINHYHTLSQALLEQIDDLQEQLNEIEMLHSKYTLERQRLLAILNKLERNKIFNEEFEELAPKFIEAHLNPNTLVDDRDNSLLMLCFKLNRLKCLRMLLSRGADVLHKNRDGHSVLSEILMGGSFTVSHQIVINHIKKLFSNLVFEFSNSPEAQRLLNIKNILDGYLAVLIKSSHMSKITRVLTGIDHHIDERKQELEKYYLYLQSAASSKDKSSLARVLEDMLILTQRSSRGLLDRSRLHDSMVVEIRVWLQSLNLESVNQEAEKIIQDFEKVVANNQEMMRKQQQQKADTYIQLITAMEDDDLEEGNEEAPEESDSLNFSTYWNSLHKHETARNKISESMKSRISINTNESEWSNTLT